MNLKLFIVAMVIFFSPLLNAQQTQNQDNINKAIEFLKIACVTTGKLEALKVEGGAKLTLRGIFSSGAEAAVSFTQQELEGLANATSKYSAAQATEMRNCMKPHIDKIIGKMIDGNVKKEKKGEPEKSFPVIKSNGKYFDAKEFNNVLRAYANSPDLQFLTRHIQYQLEKNFKVKISKAKIAHYSNIAFDNKLLNQFDEPCEEDKAYKITPKGLNYALSKGLLE